MFSRPPPPPPPPLSEDVCVWSLLESVGAGWVVSGCVGGCEVAGAASVLPSLEFVRDVSTVTAGACSLSSWQREGQTVVKLTSSAVASNIHKQTSGNNMGEDFSIVVSINQARNRHLAGNVTAVLPTHQKNTEFRANVLVCYRFLTLVAQS